MGPETLNPAAAHPYAGAWGSCPEKRVLVPPGAAGHNSLVTASALPSHLRGQQPLCLVSTTSLVKHGALGVQFDIVVPPPGDLDLNSLFSCLRHLGVEIRASVQLQCHFLFTSLFSFLSKSSASFLASSFFKADLFW